MAECRGILEKVTFNDFPLTKEPNFGLMKVPQLKQYLQVRRISVTGKKTRGTLGFVSQSS